MRNLSDGLCRDSKGLSGLKDCGDCLGLGTPGCWGYVGRDPQLFSAKFLGLVTRGLSGLDTLRIFRNFYPLILRGLSGVCSGFGTDSQAFLGNPKILR